MASSRGKLAHETDERTPLLGAAIETAPVANSVEQSTGVTETADSPDHQNNAENGEHAVVGKKDSDAPLDKRQVFLLCFTRVVEPIAFFGIIPYINFMIESVGNVDTEDVPFYSGLIESLFSATQMCVMIFWGRASDKYGRKPVLITSLFGIAIATTLFGLSQSLWQMVLFRSVAGVFAGTVVTVRAMLSESSTKQTQARAFSYFAFAGNLGIFLGPLFGAVLERPAEKYTGSFGKVQFFHDYPYALPSMFTASIAIVSAVSAMLFLQETLHVHHDSANAKKPMMSIMQILKYEGVTSVLVVYNYCMLLAFTFTAVDPAFMFTPIKWGGLGFNPQLIGLITGIAGASQAIWLLFVFPALHKRVGTGKVLRYCALAWPIFFAIHPAFNVLLRYDQRVLFWSTGPPLLALGSGVAMAFTACQLALNDIAPSHETLGTLNAMALSLSSGVRAVAPAVATAVYAVGVKYHILWGQLFWLCNVILALGFLFLLRWLPPKASGGSTISRSN